MDRETILVPEETQNWIQDALLAYWEMLEDTPEAAWAGNSQHIVLALKAVYNEIAAGGELKILRSEDPPLGGGVCRVCSQPDVPGYHKMACPVGAGLIQ